MRERHHPHHFGFDPYAGQEITNDQPELLLITEW